VLHQHGAVGDARDAVIGAVAGKNQTAVTGLGQAEGRVAVLNRSGDEQGGETGAVVGHAPGLVGRERHVRGNGVKERCLAVRVVGADTARADDQRAVTVEQREGLAAVQTDAAGARLGVDLRHGAAGCEVQRCGAVERRRLVKIPVEAP